MPTVIPSDGFRYYGKLYNTNHGAPAFQYIYDSGVVWQNDAGQLITGAERPVVPADLASTTSIDVSGGLSVDVGSVAVTGGQLSILNPLLAISGAIQGGNSIPLNVTGVINTVVTGAVSASFDTTPIVLATASGNNNTLVADRLLSGISGQLGATLNVSVINGVVPVSGVVTASVSIGNVAVTGGQIQTITTGSFSATVDNTAVILAIATGNNLLVTANQLASGISGLLASNLTDPAYITGAVSITNPVLAISGDVNLTNTAPIPVSGVTQANVTNVLLAISGNTVNTVTGWNTGNLVTVQSRSTTTVSNSIPSGVAPWTVITDMQTGQLGANPNRVMFFVQNIHTGIPTYVALNNTAAGTGNFNFILNPSQNLGYGGSSFADDHYRGFVRISGGAYVAWEL